MKKVLQWLAVCVFAVLVCVPVLAQAQTVPTTITSFRATDKNKQDLTSAYTNQDIYLTASWQAQGEVHEGDMFSLDIPDILDFPATNAASFDIYAPDGAVMATAQVTPGRVTITYTSWVEGKDNVQGTLWLAAHVKGDAAAGTTTLRLIDEATGQVVETSFEAVRPTTARLNGQCDSTTQRTTSLTLYLRITCKKEHALFLARSACIAFIWTHTAMPTPQVGCA